MINLLKDETTKHLEGVSRFAENIGTSKVNTTERG